MILVVMGPDYGYTWHDVWLENFTPCLVCNRRVKYPCHTMDSYMESGPWDYACEAYLWPERFQ